MKLELRNIRVNQQLSEETNCYSAVLYLDGKPIADVHNHGQGAPDESYPRKGCEAKLEQAEAWCKTLPPLPSQYFPDGLKMDLELWCGCRVDEHLTRSDMRRQLKKGILALDTDGKLYTYRFKKGVVITQQTIAAFAQKHPNLKILNTMAEDVALAIFKAAAGV